MNLIDQLESAMEFTPPEMTPFFSANDYRPVTAGPYECKMAGLDEEAPTHMRWFDGKHWSMPLQEEHEDLDGGFVKPEESYFLIHAVDTVPAEYEFAWRGFNDDQEPL